MCIHTLPLILVVLWIVAVTGRPMLDQYRFDYGSKLALEDIREFKTREFFPNDATPEEKVEVYRDILKELFLDNREWETKYGKLFRGQSIEAYRQHHFISFAIMYIHTELTIALLEKIENDQYDDAND